MLSEPADFLDPEEFLKLAQEDEAPARPMRNGVQPQKENNKESGGGKWQPLFERHPESGGAFKGRNNALTVLVGFMRAKRFPYEAALSFAQHWNLSYCDPPLRDGEVSERVGRAWHEWREGEIPDTTPEDFKEKPQEPKTRPKTAAELLELANDPRNAVKWIAQDFIQEEGINYISAPSGQGKTYLSLDLCRHLSDPTVDGPWLDQFDIPHKGVLYLDEENGEKTIAKRVKQLGFSMESRFWSWSDSEQRIDIPKSRQSILDLCRKHDISVVVFDSLVRFHGADEDKASQMRFVSACFRKLVLEGLTVVILHHDKKSGGMGGGLEQDKTRGSGDITAGAQAVLGLAQKGSLFTISRRKVRDAENDGRTVSYVLTPTPEGGVRLDTTTAEALKLQSQEEKDQNKLFRNKLRFLQAVSDLQREEEQATLRTVMAKAHLSKPDAIAARDGLAEDGEISIDVEKVRGGEQHTFKIPT